MNQTGHIRAISPENRFQMLQRWRDEVRYMELRLTEIGFEGDCAYERAMARFYQEQIESRQRQIAGACACPSHDPA